MWSHQPIYCTVNLDINWNELPYQARGRFRMWNAADPASTAELYPWHTVEIEPKQGTQQVKLQFVWSQAFSVGGVNGPGGPVTACQARFQQHVTQTGGDPKELLIAGFTTAVFGRVMAEPEYIPGGKTQWVNSGKRAEGNVTVRLRCGGSRAVADQAFPAPRRQVAFRTTKATLTGYLGDTRRRSRDARRRAARRSFAWSARSTTWETPDPCVVGGFMQLDRAPSAARGAQSVTLARGLTDASQLRRAIGASRTVVLVRRDGARESCRITLNGASIGEVRNERSRDQAQVTLTAQRVQDGCR